MVEEQIIYPILPKGSPRSKVLSSTMFPSIPYQSKLCSIFYTDKDVPSINIDKLDLLLNKINTDKDGSLTLADKNKHDSLKYQNNSIDSDNDLLNIDSWFGPELMILMFISSIISILGFIILICYRNSKVIYAISYVLGTTAPVKGYDIDPFSCSYDFL